MPYDGGDTGETPPSCLHHHLEYFLAVAGYVWVKCRLCKKAVLLTLTDDKRWTFTEQQARRALARYKAVEP